MLPGFNPLSCRSRRCSLSAILPLSSLLRSRRGPSDPVSPRFRTSSLCPRSCVPAGVLRPRIPAFPHLFSLSRFRAPAGALRPRIPAFPHLFSLSRFRAPAGALRQSGPPPPSHEKSSPEFRRGFFVSRAPSTRCSPLCFCGFGGFCGGMLLLFARPIQCRINRLGSVAYVDEVLLRNTQ